MASSSSLPNASLSWSQNRRSEQRIKPSATLDLHGYGKEEAIRAVTNFFDDQARSSRDPWVHVITGVGAHSGALGGPILKQAIHKLLVKRNMEFSYCKKPRGMFLVNVQSGHVLKHNPTAQEQFHATGGDASDINIVQETPWQDTKVKVVQREFIPGATAPKLPSQQKKATGKKARKDMINNQYLAQAAGASYSTTTTTMTGPQHHNHHAPRPSELAADQRMLDQAKKVSLQDSRKAQSRRDREENAVKEAIQKTQQEALEEKRLEEEELQRALALSEAEPQQPQQHQQLTRHEEEEELARILELSLKEQQPPQRKDTFDEEEELQSILAKSNLDYMQQQQEEEAELQRVIRMSMVESQQQQLIPDPPENNEETLRDALRMSLVESTGPGMDGEHQYNDDQPLKEAYIIEESAFQDESSELPTDETLHPYSTCNPQNILQENGSNTPSLEPSSCSGTPSLSTESQHKDTSSTAQSDGEALLESILYNKPLPASLQPPSGRETKKAPETNSSIQFNLDSPTKSNNELQQPTLLQPSRATTPQQQQQQQQPILPAPILEHRLMEILQRPIVLPSSQRQRHPEPNTGVPVASPGTSLSSLATSFTPTLGPQATVVLAGRPASPGQAAEAGNSCMD